MEVTACRGWRLICKRRLGGISGIHDGVTRSRSACLGRKDALSPLRWAINLPSMAAGYYERQGKPLDDASMAAVELYSRTEFVTTFWQAGLTRRRRTASPPKWLP